MVFCVVSVDDFVVICCFYVDMEVMGVFVVCYGWLVSMFYDVFICLRMLKFRGLCVFNWRYLGECNCWEYRIGFCGICYLNCFFFDG